MEMLRYDGPVIFDCLVEKHENCFPMIPSGKPHNEMLLGEADTQGVIGAKGRGAGVRSKHSAYDLRDPHAEAVERHTLAVIVDNEAGVLARVIGLFSGRGYNIESLTVAEVDHEGHRSRITVVTSGTPQVIDQIKAQLARMVPVHEVHDLTGGAFGAARTRALQGGREGEPGRGAAAGRHLPRERGRFDAQLLRLRDHRHAREDRRLRRT
jgi:acetolactate synthase regulatory subunit